MIGLSICVTPGSRTASGPPLAITGTPVTTGTDGTAYAGFTATASGGTAPYTYSLVGTWPTGISINSSTGVVNGTPSQSGSFTGLSVRVTDGAAATADLSSFTLTVAAATDPNFANVVFLAGFEGADGATSYTEESSIGASATFLLGAQIETSDYAAGSSSLHLVKDAVTFPARSDYLFGDGEYTVECFVKNVDGVTLNTSTLIGVWDTNNQLSWAFVLTKSGNYELRLRTSTDGSATITANSPSRTLAASFFHMAVDREISGANEIIRIYFNGTNIYKTTRAKQTLFASSANLVLGAVLASGSPSAANFTGFIDEARITKGVARYKSDTTITIPSLPLPRS